MSRRDVPIARRREPRRIGEVEPEVERRRPKVAPEMRGPARDKKAQVAETAGKREPGHDRLCKPVGPRGAVAQEELQGEADAQDEPGKKGPERVESHSVEAQVAHPGFPAGVARSVGKRGFFWLGGHGRSRLPALTRREDFQGSRPG